MGIGTILGSSYTPPNLNGYLLCGSNSTYLINTTGGNNTPTLSVNNLPSHNHGGTATTTNSSTGTSHTHTFTDYYYLDNSNTPKAEGGDGAGNSDINRTTNPAVYTDHDVSIDKNGGNSSINVENKSYIINWIIKF